MDANFVNSFVQAAEEVLGQELGADIQRGDLSVGVTDFTTEDINIVIGIIGNLEGQAFYCCSDSTAKQFAQKMSGEESVSSDLIVDAIAELANVITGRATILLEDNKFNLNLSPPALIQGQGVKVGTYKIKTVNVPLTTPSGNLTLKVGLRTPETAS